MRDVLGISKGLNKRNGIGGKMYRGEGGRKLFSVGGLVVSLPTLPRFLPPPLGVLWFMFFLFFLLRLLLLLLLL